MKKAFTPSSRISEFVEFQKIYYSKLSLSYIFLMFSLVSFSSFAQTSPSGQIKFITPTTLSACNTDTICVELTNLKGSKGVNYSGNATIEVNIPGGTLVEYINNSVKSTPAGATQVSYVSNKLTIAVPLPATGLTTKICFVVRPDCNIANLSTLPKFTGKITYPASFPISTENFNSSSLNVGVTTLSHTESTTYPFNPTVSYSTGFWRGSTITNNGYGNISEVIFTTIHDQQIDLTPGTVLSIYTSKGATPDTHPVPSPSLLLISSTTSGNQVIKKYRLSGTILGADKILTPNEQIVFFENYTVPAKCATYTTKILAEYSCGIGKMSCQKPDTLTSKIYASAGTPKLDGTLVLAENPDGCPNKKVEYKVKNNGVGNAAPVGNAYDVDLNIQFGSGLMTISNVKLNGVAVPVANIYPTAAGTSFNIKLKNFMTTDPDGTGGISDIDSDGFFDDMLVGAETIVTFDYTIPCDLACGANLYYRLTSNATFTDFCHSLNGSTSTFLKEFGFQQVQAINQTKKVDYGILTTGQSKIDTAKFTFQYKAFNVDLTATVAEIRIRYDKKMEVNKNYIRFNGVQFTNAPTYFGSNTNAPTDLDSMIVIQLTSAELTTLFDATPDKFEYEQTFYGCTDRQNTFVGDNWQLIVKLKSGLCTDGSTPCGFDLACKKPFAFSSGNACGVKPCYVNEINLKRSSPLGFTAVNESNVISPIDSLHSYEGDTVIMKHELWMSNFDVQEPNGFYTNQGKANLDLRTFFSLLYTKPKGWNGNTNIWKFLPVHSKVVIRQRTPDPTDLKKKGTIGAVILEVPLLLEDFASDASSKSATSQTRYALDKYTYPAPAGSTIGGATWYCNNSPTSWHIKDVCPVLFDGFYRDLSTQNISYARYVNETDDKVRDVYYLNIGKALARAGWTGNAGDNKFYFDVQMQWQTDDSFPWDNSNSWSVYGSSQHQGNYPTVPNTIPGSTYNGSCDYAEDTHLTVTKEHFISNPGAVYNAQCGLRVTNKVFFKSFEGNYFNNGTGEVRVPLKIDSVVANIPTQYAITAGTVSLKYNQGCAELNTSSITASALTGKVKFTNTAGGDFPRADDCSGNKVAYDLCYTLTKTGTAAPTQYKIPIKIYTRDEFDNVKVLIDTATIAEAKPELILTSITPVLNNSDGGACQPAYFDFKIQNNTLYAAPNVYFAAESSVGTTMLRIIDHPDSTYSDPIIAGDVSTFGASNLFAKLGTVGAGDIRIVRVFASTNICSDNFKVYADYGCSYPTPLQPLLTSTTLDQATAQYIASTPQMLSRVITGSLNITELCTDQDVELEIRNASLSNIYKLLTTVKLPTSMQFVASSAQIKHPVSGTYTNITNVTVVAPDSIRFDLSANSPFNTSCGLTGSDTTTLNDVRIKFKVKFVACPTTTSDEMFFYVSGESYCGTKRSIQNVLPVYYIGSAGKQNNYTLSTVNTPLKVCAGINQTQAINDKIYIKNIGGFGTASGVSSGQDSVTFTIPFDATKLVLSNFTVGSPFSSPVMGTDPSGNKTIRVLIPAGLAVGDSIALPLNYDLLAKVDKLCLADATPLICYFGQFSSPVLLACTTKGLNCGGVSKNLRGSGLSLRSIDCCYGSIGDYVWTDTNNDGQQGAPLIEKPIKDVRVYLYDGTGTTKLDSTFTDVNGKYLFDSLFTGSYKIKFALSPTMLVTKQNLGGDDTKDNDINSTGWSQLVNINTNLTPSDTLRNNPNVDAGIIFCQITIPNITVSQSTCTGSTANGDAKIEFTATNSDKYKITQGASSTATYATSISLTSGAGSLLNVANPVSATQYTLRVFNGSDACFKDTTITLQPKVCALPPCSITLTSTPSTCTPATNTYGVTGILTFANAPVTGTLTVSDGTKTQVFNAPFTSTQAYSLTGITSDGASHTVTAIFSATPTCTNTVTYIAPISCACPPQNNKICAGESYTLTAQAGMTGYQWYSIVGIDTLAISSATTASFTATTTGTFIWKAKDANGCDIKLCCPVIIIPGNCYGSIGDYVWTDTNNDGQQAGEAPIQGVKVYLLDGVTGAKLDSTNTDATGKYLFDSLLTGAYKVQFVAPIGTIASKQNTGADVSDSDANKAGLSQLINIDTTKLPTDTLRNNPQIDAGFVPVGSIGDYVFEDLDKSNTQTAGDTPLAGVKVYLLNAATGAKLDSTTTDANGLYLFDSLVAGNYKVQFVAPSGTLLVGKTSGTDITKDSNPDPTTGITDAVTIDTTQPIGSPARDNRDVDAGIKLIPAYGSIGDYVWSDVNNNGQQDGTETPIAGVKVYLYDATGTTKLDSTLTDGAGKYLFDSLLTGAYKVKFVAPAGTFLSKQNIGADVTDSDANKLGWSQVVNIDATKSQTDTLRNNPQIDAGFVPFGSIGDYVFNDKDNSNTQSVGDLPVEGVKVYLLDATTGAKLDSTVTNAAGLYKFDSLIAGNYKVQVVPPTGMLVVTKDSGTDDTKDSDIDATGTTSTITVDVTKPVGDPLRDITSVDAGIKGNPQYGSIGDYVWFDVNNDGQQGDPLVEKPIAGVKVYLYDATGTTKLDSTLTDALGKYNFDSLLTGGYKVKFAAPAGTFPAKQNIGADVSDSDANKLGFSQVVNIDVTKLTTDTLRNNPQIDAGFVPFGSLGDYVFEDKDNSNTQTAGDLPISGVKVYLLDATTGAKLDSTITNGAGKYLFDSLVAGNYKVQFVAPSGSLLVTKTSGTDATKDSNPDPATGITDAVTIDTTQPIGSPARDNRDVDAGVKAAPQFGSIGDYVWTDTNNNGQQDGTESPIAGVKVYLYDATGTTKLDSTLTDASGKYLFDSLITAGYKVKFVAPAGTIAAKQNTGADVSDSDANKLGWSQLINIDASLADTDTLRNNPQIDAGFVPVGSIGDYVFIDKDNSNTQTTGDLPMEGVKVYLLDATTGAKLDSTYTNASGLYKFDSLIAGNYKVQFVVPTGMTAVTKDSGTDDTKDSDIDPTGTTGTVTVDTTKPIGDPLRDITNVDAGLKGIPQYGSLGDYVWFDNNNNGQQDGTESPIQGVKVYLYDAAGTTKLDSALTDATGKYLFDSLLTGGYKVKFVAPTGTLPAKQNIGADVSDSDANKLGWSQVVNIDVTKLATDTLRNNPQIDAGFVPFGSIGDFVFQDKDNSNTQTVGDTPIPCIVVYLLDATTGAKLDSTMTDISGKYLFDSLLAGNYKIQFVAPIGGTFVTPLSGGDVIKDSNPDATGLTATVTIDPTQAIGSPARDNRDVDAGLKIVGPFGSIGDYVWSDVNNNGQQDGTEAPIAGVKVYLYDGTGTTIMDSTVTDATGKYLFDSLFTADYKVKFVAPAGTIASKQNTGADITDSDANKAGWSQIISIDVTKLATDTLRNNPQIDAGFVPVGSIGDYVFEDKDNSNTQTAGDSPIQGVKVYLLNATTGAKLDSTITDGAGKYLFDSLIAGNYKVQFVAPAGTDLVTKTSGTDVTKDSNPDPMTGITDTVTINTTQPIGSPARDNRDVDAGIKASLAYGSLGDYVWMDTDNDGQQDAAEAPIAGVKVYLYDASGTNKLDSALTDATGKYLFDSLLTGGYKVKFVAPAGTIAAKQNKGADVTDSDANKLGWSQVVNIDVTLAETDTLRNNPKIDAGFIPVGSIGDYVFNDKDNSNTQTTGDLPVEGVKVYLLDATTGAKLDSTVTNSAGLYKFDSLIAGNYKVQVVAPTGMTVVTKDSGTDDTKDSDIDPTGTTGIVNVDTTKPIGDPLRDITNVDAGLKVNPAYGSIGNFVWTDQNNNGQQDGTETPIEGVKIYLYDGTGTVLLDSTLTNAAGNYLFDSLLTGSYKVKFVAPVGTIPAKQNTGADVSDSDANKLGWSQVVNIDVAKVSTDTLRNNPQIDAGFVPVGSIGDYVFNDKDDSKTQTAGDLPIGGVKVYLLDATTGAKLDSTITDGAGKYLFDSLVAGNYKVKFVAPVGTNLVTKTSGTDVTKDSNPDPATGITDAVTIDTTKPIGNPLRDNRDVDAGIKGQPQYGSLGDYVWMDTDNDGQQDATEAPIAGVKVYLYDAAGLVKIDSALTDATGKYLFDSLLTGGYKVKFVAPAGTIAAKQNTGADVTDSDANKAGWSQVVNIDVTLSSTDTLRNNPKIDAGFVPVGSIGDYVFVDNDNSNTQTAGDTPVAGVKVYLLDAVTGAKLDSTVTNINGLYKFDSLVAGNYKVQFVAPTGATLVTKDSGADDTKDSDADATGTTGIIMVDTTKPVGDIARDITSVDAGLSFKVDLRLTKVAVGDCKRKVGDVVSFKVMVKRQDLIITDVTTTIKDSLSANFEFVSSTATEGTYSNTTGIWSGITLAKGDSAVLTVNARIKQGVAGLACNDAWIQTMDKGDFDSIAGNKIETEDDFARACVSVPLPVCTARGEKAELSAPVGYTNYQWLKNGQVIAGATSSTYMATTFGEYTVTVNNGSCPSTGCCPIYVEEFCDCPPVICVPYVIQKTKSKK